MDDPGMFRVSRETTDTLTGGGGGGGVGSQASMDGSRDVQSVQGNMYGI